MDLQQTSNPRISDDGLSPSSPEDDSETENFLCDLLNSASGPSLNGNEITTTSEYPTSETTSVPEEATPLSGPINIVLSRARMDNRVIENFGGERNTVIVEWRGMANADVLFLMAFPSVKDVENAVLDSNNAIFTKAMNAGLKQNKIAIASCCVAGDASEKFKSAPTPQDIIVSISYLKRLLLQMHHLKVVVALDAFTMELLMRNLNVPELYGRTEERFITKYDTPSSNMFRRKVKGDLVDFHIEGRKTLKAVYIHTFNKHFDSYLQNARVIIYDKTTPLKRQVVDRCPEMAPDAQNPSAPQHKLNSFLKLLTDDITECNALSEPINHAEHPFSMVKDARRSIDPNQKHFYVLRSEYDNARNAMKLFARLPSGAPALIWTNDVVHTFWFRAHIAFAERPDLWYNRTNNMPLQQHHLHHLNKLVKQKLFWMKKLYPQAFSDSSRNEVEPFAFVAEEPGFRYAYNDGYTHEYKPTFIRCDVRHHAYVQKIAGVLRKIVSQYVDQQRLEKRAQPKKRTRDNMETDDREKYFEHMESRFHILNAAAPPIMFSSRYGSFNSHWHSSDCLNYLYTENVDGTNVGRCNVYEINLKNENSLKCIKPLPDIQITDALTAMDAPPSIRMSYDIECFSKNGGFPSAYVDPVVCICATVREHDDKKSTFDDKINLDPVTKKMIAPFPKYTPNNGYVYHSFVLGNISIEKKGVATSDGMVGTEHVHSFANEADLIAAFFHWRRALFPTYIYTHNGKDFDERYLINRANVLGVKIPAMGYIPTECLRISQYKFYSRGTQEKTITTIDGQYGITMADTLEITLKDFKLKSWTLNYIASAFVHMTKAEMPYPAIGGYWRKDDDSRRVLVDYCYRDAQLPDQIITCKQLVTNIIAISRASGVTEDRIYESGMQEKVFGALVQSNFERGGRVLFNSSDAVNKVFNDAITMDFAPDKPVLGKRKSKSNDEEEDEEDNDDMVIAVIGDNPQPPVEKNKNKKQKTGIKSFFNVESKISKPKEGSASSSSSSSSSSSASISRKDISEAVRKINVQQNATERDAKYQGAVVMSVPFGWHYKLPSGCLDFASLYPSIMRAYNMSSCTMVFEDDAYYLRIDIEKMCMEPSKDYTAINPRTKKKVRIFFVNREYRVGLLAATEDTLVTLRNVFKNLISKYGNEFLDDGVTPNPNYNPNIAANLTKISDALKGLGNSAYGAAGSDGNIGNKVLAGAVTAVGRDGIMLARYITETEFGGICAGGDTDSIFMMLPGDKDGNYRCETVAEMEKFAEEVWVPRVNKEFKYPMKLEYEKAMFPLFTNAKKRYVFGFWEKGKIPYLRSKGMETVRRDSLPFTSVTLNKLFEMLIVIPSSDMDRQEYLDLIENRKKEACDYVRSRAKDLLSGNLPITDLILSKNLSCEYYASANQEHLTVANLRKERGLKPPSVGERIYYVYTLKPNDPETNKAPCGYKIADDPAWVIKNNIKINYAHYMEKKYIDPIVRFMTYILKDEMIERITKRFNDKNNGITRAFNAKNPEPNRLEVTLKMLKEETKDYLFSMAKSRTVYVKNQQSRFLSLTGRKVAKPSMDPSAKYSIASFCKDEETNLEKMRTKYEIYNDDQAVLHKVREDTEAVLTTYQNCLSKCRSCLKISDTSPINCDAYDCKDYYPRIVSEGKYADSTKLLNSVIEDIENIV